MSEDVSIIKKMSVVIFDYQIETEEEEDDVAEILMPEIQVLL